MNANTQFDLHPDAESLNAFAEQTLAERERGRSWRIWRGAAAAGKSCFLAQEAAAEMEPAVEVAALRPAVRRGSWLRSWWFVWTPTAALAAAVGVAVYVHVRRVEVESEMAKVTTQTAPRLGVSNAGPAAAAPEKKDEAEARVKPGPAQPASEKRQAKKERPEAPTFAASPPGAFASESYGMRESKRSEADVPAVASGAGNPEPRTMAEARPEPAESAMRENQAQTSGAYESRAMDAAMAAKKSARAKTDELERSERSGGMQAAAASPSAQASPAPPPSYPLGAVLGPSGAFAAYKARPSELPSGLPAVSSVAAMSRMLAIDPAGSVFLSEDAGIRWKSVEKQWEGRAIRCAFRKDRVWMAEPRGQRPRGLKF